MKLGKRILSLLFAFIMLCSTGQVYAAEEVNTETNYQTEDNTTNPDMNAQNHYHLTVVVEGIGNVEIPTDSERVVQGETGNTYTIQEGTEITALLQPDESYYIVYAELNGELVEINDIYATFTMPAEDAELLVLYDKIEIGRNMLPIPFADQVTYNQTITNSYGNKTSKFQVNGIWAWCCDAHNTTPAKGDAISSIVESTNVNLLKVLWYGCLGPGAILANDNDGWMQTGQAASMALGNGRVHSRYEAWYNSVITKEAPPAGFKAYIATPANGKQKLTYFVYTPVVNGYLTATKTSMQPSITDGNSFYSLNGAEYGVYSDSNCTTLVGTLTFNAAGVANTLELKEGTYYLKETKAPAGYCLSTTVTSATVTAGNTTRASVSNRPQLDPVGILISKVDADTNENVAAGRGTLMGAQFTVKYYKGSYSSNPAASGATPTRQWVFETDQDGFCYFSSQYLVSGDAFYTNSSGIPSIPLGTITIQETKAPEGYLLNPEIYVRQIVANGAAENVDTYNYPIIKENSFRLDLVKMQEGTEIAIPNVQFEHTRPDGSTEILVTDSEGKLSIQGLEYGTHSVREVSVMSGYLLNDNVITFIVNEDNSVVNTSEFDANKGDVVFEMTTDGNIRLYVYDKVDPYSLVVHKSNDKGTVLAGTEFTIYADEECTIEVSKGITDENGELRIEGLNPERRYYLKETKAPAGYRIPVDEDGNPYIYEIYATSVPVQNEFLLYVDGQLHTESEGAFDVTGSIEGWEAHIGIVDDIGVVLPHTGSAITIAMLLLGSICCFVSFVIGRRRPKYE